MTESSPYSDENREPIFLNTGIDIFYGMLTKPIQTLNMLSNPETQPAAFSPLLCGLLIVALSSLAGISMNSGSLSFTTTAIMLNFVGSFIGTIFFWSVLAIFLRMLAAIFKVKTSMRICFTATGWAFLPLIFRGMANCFSCITVFGGILMCCLSIWFLLLQLFAFDSILKLGGFKTLGVILILPPCLFFAYFVSLIFAGAIISDALF